eukprot:TRINITY_DN29388_c0_g1_i2.p1 TRINITY_DN29388_c0_g1~~TRINITY_DN29388_c0_g1_i2.p1  ORF type:complete len:106 (+),score=12.22 TRINITY_DN29388_c0_g1_i2:512-829(+)
MCVGDRIAVLVPPLMAYDDPTMDFPWLRGDVMQRPAPPGSSIRLELELLSLKEPGVSTRSPCRTLVATMSLVAFIVWYTSRNWRAKSGDAVREWRKLTKPKTKKA